MKKSADSNITAVQPVLCLTSQRFPQLAPNHAPPQTHISVFLEFVNEMHTHTQEFQPGPSSSSSSVKQPLNHRGVRSSAECQRSDASSYREKELECFLASLHMIKSTQNYEQ